MKALEEENKKLKETIERCWGILRQYNRHYLSLDEALREKIRELSPEIPL